MPDTIKYEQFQGDYISVSGECYKYNKKSISFFDTTAETEEISSCLICEPVIPE